MSDLEGVGDAITGGVLARAVEPNVGEDGHTHETHCLNCRAELTGPYCRMCGQHAHVHRTLSAIGHDLIHGVLHLDGKLWRTLGLLIWRPGALTRRYAHGERAKFVSPLGMFLFSVFLMFAVLQIFGLSLSSLESVFTNADASIETAARASQAELAQKQADRADIQAALDGGGRPDRAPRRRERLAELDRQIAETAANVQRLEAMRQQASSARTQITQVHTGWARLDYGIHKFVSNPGLTLYKLQANGYKFSWLLIPITVPFVWIMFFWTRRYRMYDHSVFVTYSLTFLSLLAVALTLAGFAGLPKEAIAIAATFAVPVHMFRQLKGAYDIGWFGALVRTAILVTFYEITFTLFFVLLLGIGALG